FINPMNEENQLSIADAAQKLSLQDNTLRKYLNFFELKVEKVGRKNLVLNDTMRCLEEIIQLKSNGWSLKQIKDFRAKQEEIPEKSQLETKSSESISTEGKLSEKASSSTTNNKEQVNKEGNPKNNSVNEAKLSEPSEKELNSRNQNYPHSDNNQPSNSKREEEHTASSNEKEEELPRQQDRNKRRSHEEIEDSNDDDSEDEREDSADTQSEERIKRQPLSKDMVNREISNQARRVSRLNRFSNSRSGPRDAAEIRSDLNRRIIFLNGLRYFRDNWLERNSEPSNNRRNNNDSSKGKDTEDKLTKV
ncbi:MAG TPA: MerR family transcriptional regulator, partial [Vampirovibrionales bacterium]